MANWKLYGVHEISKRAIYRLQVYMSNMQDSWALGTFKKPPNRKAASICYLATPKSTEFRESERHNSLKKINSGWR